MRTETGVVLALALSLCAPTARAESARFFELEGLGHFLDGNPESTAVTEDGAVTLPPATRERYADPAQVFAAVAALGDELAVARVEDGAVMAIARDGHTRNLFRPEEAMVTALLATPGGLLVATAPGGKIYRVAADGAVAAWSQPACNYVWGLAAAGDGGAYAVSGEPGVLWHLHADGRADKLFEPQQAHLRSIAVDPARGIFVGGGERGIVYHGPFKGPFRALFDTGSPEITALVVRGDDVVAAAVTGAAALAADAGEGSKKGGGKPPEVRSQVLRIDRDGAADVLAASADEAVLALAVDTRGNVLVATGAAGRDDPRGRLYSVDPNRHTIALVLQSPSRRLTHLVALPGRQLAAVAAGGARIVEMDDVAARRGEFLTAPFDAGVNSRFGSVEVLGVVPAGSEAVAELRSGQSAEPDASWSAWGAAVTAPGRGRAAVPNGRFMQARLTLRSRDGTRVPQLHRLRVAYLRQNLPPFVREVTVLRRGLALWPLPRDEAKGKLVAIADRQDDARPDEPPRRAAGPTRARQVPEHGALTVKWVSDDPNGDELAYTLCVRAADAPADAWRVVDTELSDPFCTLRAASFADGYYYFRVRVTDAPSNPPERARADFRDSRAVLVDNTPPRLGPLRTSVRDGRVVVRGTAADALSALSELTYALDGGTPRPVLPEDGVLDGPEEAFTIVLPGLAAGRHTVTVHVRDEADNEATTAEAFTVR